jgi:uridine kinase
VLSLDSWLKPAADRAEGTGVTSRFDIDRIVSTLEPMVRSPARRALELPIYDRARRAVYEERVDMSVGADDLLIVEGVPALMIPALVALAGVRVHVEMPEPRRTAHLRADYTWRGEDPASVDRLLASRKLDETGPVQEARSHATVVLDAWVDA